MASLPIHKLKGATILKVRVVKRDYGLPQEVIITASDGHDYVIDGDGLHEGECSYPQLNFRRVKTPEPKRPKWSPNCAAERRFRAFCSK